MTGARLLRSLVVFAAIAALLVVARPDEPRAADANLVPVLAAATPPPLCDNDGVSVKYSSNYVPTASPATFRVQSATIGSIDVSCAGLGLTVKLRQGTTVLATGGPVSITGTTTAVPFPVPPQAKQVTGVTVEIQLMVPAQCSSIIFKQYLIGSMAGHESLGGASGNTYVLARGPDVHLVGGSGNDCLVGGRGANDFVGSSGNDVLIGGAGPDHLDGGSGDDVIVGGSGTNDFVGGSGRDLMTGGPLRNSFDGGSDNDVMIGGPGANDFVGGSGVDTCHGSALGPNTYFQCELS